jgi:hypothetical protein
MKWIAYGTGELPAMIASSRDYHAYRSQGHAPGSQSDMTWVASALTDNSLTEALLFQIEPARSIREKP